MRKVLKEGQNSDSAGKHTGSGSAKVTIMLIINTLPEYLVFICFKILINVLTNLQGSKRKSSPKMNSSAMKKMDLSDFDPTRLPLYPLQTENVIPTSSELYPLQTDKVIPTSPEFT